MTRLLLASTLLLAPWYLWFFTATHNPGNTNIYQNIRIYIVDLPEEALLIIHMLKKWNGHIKIQHLAPDKWQLLRNILPTICGQSHTLLCSQFLDKENTGQKTLYCLWHYSFVLDWMGLRKDLSVFCCIKVRDCKSESYNSKIKWNLRWYCMLIWWIFDNLGNKISHNRFVAMTWMIICIIYD